MKIENIEGFKDLQPKTKRWIKGICNQWQLDEHHKRLLVLAGASFDRALQAKSIVDAEGPVIEDRFGQKKNHPAVDVEKQASITFCRILREVGLDLTVAEDSRPGMNPGGY